MLFTIQADGDRRLLFSKLQTGTKLNSSMTVDDFVADKASNFNKVQQTSTCGPQQLQQQSLRISKNP
jgi:hypothetical protein